MAISGISNRLNYCIIFIVHTVAAGDGFETHALTTFHSGPYTSPVFCFAAFCGGRSKYSVTEIYVHRL